MKFEDKMKEFDSEGQKRVNFHIEVTKEFVEQMTDMAIKRLKSTPDEEKYIVMLSFVSSHLNAVMHLLRTMDLAGDAPNEFLPEFPELYVRSAQAMKDAIPAWKKSFTEFERELGKSYVAMGHFTEEYE